MLEIKLGSFFINYKKSIQRIKKAGDIGKFEGLFAEHQLID